LGEGGVDIVADETQNDDFSWNIAGFIYENKDRWWTGGRLHCM